jgi:uncharacterized protein
MSLPPRLYDGFLPGRHPIQGFGQKGFRFGEMSHRGSVLAVPSGIYDWVIREPFQHDELHYDAIFAEASQIDIVLIGAGMMPLPLPESLRWRFREKGISADVMTTASACSTYNVLLGEGRRVAAALVAVL